MASAYAGGLVALESNGVSSPFWWSLTVSVWNGQVWCQIVRKQERVINILALRSKAIEVCYSFYLLSTPILLI